MRDASNLAHRLFLCPPISSLYVLLRPLANNGGLLASRDCWMLDSGSPVLHWTDGWDGFRSCFISLCPRTAHARFSDQFCVQCFLFALGRLTHTELSIRCEFRWEVVVISGARVLALHLCYCVPPTSSLILCLSPWLVVAVRISPFF